jgi:hypothetical protein
MGPFDPAAAIDEAAKEGLDRDAREKRRSISRTVPIKRFSDAAANSCVL